MKDEHFRVLCDEALSSGVKPIDTMTVEELRERCRVYRGALLEIAANGRFDGWQCDSGCDDTADVALFGVREHTPMYAEDLARWSKTP